MRILIVINAQNDFIIGSLGTTEAQEVIPAMVKKVQEFDGIVLYTQDRHYKDYYWDTLEGQAQPVEHCMTDTEGIKIQKDVWEAGKFKNHPRFWKFYDQDTVGSVRLAKDIKSYDENVEPGSWKEGIDDITLIGLHTDTNVLTNALLLKSFTPEIPIIVDPACCAGTTPGNHSAALRLLKANQVNIDRKVKRKTA